MRMFFVFALVSLLAAIGQAQTVPPPQVTLTWTAPTSGPTPTGYNVYRYASSCPAQIAISTATKLNTSALTALTYVDTAVTRGTVYCYFVTAVTATGESAASGTATAMPPLYTAQAAPNPPPGAPGVQPQ